MADPTTATSQPPPVPPPSPTSRPAAPEPPAEPTKQEKEIETLKDELRRFRDAGNELQKRVSSLKEQLNQSPKLPSSLKLPPLDKYSGNKQEDLLAWLFQVNEQMALLRMYDDETRIMFAGTALTQNAKTWYHAVRSEKSVRTWDDFQTKLKANFYPLDPVKHARDQLHPLLQMGSVRDYTATFRHLTAIIGNMSEDEKLDRYIRGLKTRTRNQVELKEPDSFEEACRLAEMIDVSNDRIFGNASRAAYFPPKNRRQFPEPMDLGAIQDNRRDKPKFTKLTPEEKDRRRRDGLCLYCGSNRHKLDDCPLRKPQGKAPQRLNRGAR